MKYILTNVNNEIYGPFDKVEQFDLGYICDGTIYYSTITGDVVVSEVSNEYMTPSQIEIYNNEQSELRAKAYPIESDPIFFQWQRGLKTQREWLDAVEQVKIKYPYK